MKSKKKKISKLKTSRDRPKSEPYPRLKNSKRTSKCQFTVLENRKTKKMDRVARRGPLARAPGAVKKKGGTIPKLSTFLSQLKGGPFGEKTNFRKVSQCRKTERGTLCDFKHPFCCKISKKLKGGPFGEKKFRKKVSQCRKKTEKGALWNFSTSILSQNSKIIEGGPLWGKNFQKSLAVPKKLKGDPLLSPGMVCYAGKQEKPFWFSSLGQMVQ